MLALAGKEQVKVELGLLALGALVWLEVDNKVVLDGENSVGCEPWVVLGVDLSNDVLVVGVGDLRNWSVCHHYKLEVALLPSCGCGQDALGDGRGAEGARMMDHRWGESRRLGEGR